MTDELRILAVNGMLGYGYPVESLDAGLALAPHLLGVDSGSTDAGPFYLGAGASLVRPEQIERDLRPALVRAVRHRVPLVIGSAGFAGASANVDLLLGILRRIAREEGLAFRLAVIRTDVDPGTVVAALRAGLVEPMAGVPELTEEAVRASSNVVAQIGVEPIAAALARGADVVVCGRACDTAIYAALPIARGFDPGLALHMAKILECGAQCAIPLAPNDSLLGILRRDHFLIRTLAEGRGVTAESVAAHTLYEQPDPLWLAEPEGRVDLSGAEFEEVDPRTVRVSGARLVPWDRPLRLKLEGARRVGARAFVLAGIADRDVIASLPLIEETVRGAVERNLPDRIRAAGYTLGFRVYGRDAVLGDTAPAGPPPREVGVLIEAIADAQDDANAVCSLARSSFLHCPFPGRKTTAGNLAFPFSPSDAEGGDVYEFSVYHLMQVDDQPALFPVELEEIR
ncbi:MAG: acyclic terpene utilization AtuA family protein [Thermoleophilia bacterium]